MTPLLAPYVLLGLDAVMLVGGVWLLAHALKTWRAERRLETEKPRTTPTDIAA